MASNKINPVFDHKENYIECERHGRLEGSCEIEATLFYYCSIDGLEIPAARCFMHELIFPARRISKEEFLVAQVMES